MDKDLETLSALYDGELDERDTRINLEKISLDEGLKNTFHKLGVISELVQRNASQKDSKIGFLINELGDEPQTRKLNYMRAAISDISLTPDYECYKYWKGKNFNCFWFTHWADSKIFYLKNQAKRKYFIGKIC